MGYDFTHGLVRLTARPSGALHWADRGMLIVSDLHFGKSDRLARRGATLIPPYETRATLEKLGREIEETGAKGVVCLGDSFDDLQAATSMDPADQDRLAGLMAGRDWVWVEGNHDPGPAGFGGQNLAELTLDGVTFRHIGGGPGPEVSGHYHPKARLAGRSHPCFVIDHDRVILPAYGTFTGGLWVTDPVFARLMNPSARAVLTGRICRTIPVPRSAGTGRKN